MESHAPSPILDCQGRGKKEATRFTHIWSGGGIRKGSHTHWEVKWAESREAPPTM